MPLLQGDDASSGRQRLARPRQQKANAYGQQSNSAPGTESLTLTETAALFPTLINVAVKNQQPGQVEKRRGRTS